jgi:nucleotide-binding universal stress UspA family protein
MDFSENAHLALDVALDIGNRLPTAELHPLHLFRVPKGYSHKGKTGDELHGLMQDMAKEEYEEFMKGIDLRGLKAQAHFLDATDHAPGEMIYETTKDEEAGMLLVGARGHSEFSAFMLGSFTESLIRYGTPIPLFVIKDQKSLSLLEALFKL